MVNNDAIPFTVPFALDEEAMEIPTNEESLRMKQQEEIRRHVEQELLKSSSQNRPGSSSALAGVNTSKAGSRDRSYSYRMPLTRNARLTDLIKALWSTEHSIVSAALWQMQELLDQQHDQVAHGDHHNSSDYDDNDCDSLALTVVRRGGHLAIMHALEKHGQVEAIQAIGLSLLAWLCERCNIKSILLGKGAFTLTTDTILHYTSVSSLVVVEGCYLLGNLATLPKVAEKVAVQPSLVFALLAALDVWPNNSAVADATFFWVQRVSSHKLPAVLDALWRGDCLSLIVQYMQQAIEQWEVCKNQGTKYDDTAMNLEARLDSGCCILMHWAKTPGRTSHVTRTMIEAGALTLTAELLRLFPPGTPLMKAAQLCLRAMVPALSGSS